MSTLPHSRRSPDLSRSRKFGGEDVALLLLSLLADGELHGYGLRQALQTRSNGFYIPSPGVLYPALALLEARAWATVEVDGNRKSYAATALGLQELAREAERVALLWAGLDHAARKSAWLRRTAADDAPVLGPDGEDVATGWVPEFIQARVAFKQALLLRGAASPEQQRQMARILTQAAAEIEAACPLPPTAARP